MTQRTTKPATRRRKVQRLEPAFVLASMVLLIGLPVIAFSHDNNSRIAMTSLVSIVLSYWFKKGAVK